MANMTFKADLVPQTNLGYSLGSSSLKWKINGVADPKLTDTDTKNTSGSSNSASKLFLTGATEQSANPVTYSHTAVYATAGVLNATSYTVAATAQIVYNTSNTCLEIIV